MLGTAGVVVALAAGLDGCAAPRTWGTVTVDGATIDAWAVATDERSAPRDTGFTQLVIDPDRGLAALVYLTGEGGAGCIDLASSVEQSGDVVRLRVGDWQQGFLVGAWRDCPSGDERRPVGGVFTIGDLAQYEVVVDGTCLQRSGIREACERPVVEGDIERGSPERP